MLAFLNGWRSAPAIVRQSDSGAHLEIVIFAIALIQNERSVVGDRVPFERRDLADTGDFVALGDLLLVQSLFGQPNHCVTSLTRIPEDTFRHRPVIKVLRSLVRGGRANHHCALDMLFSNALGGSRCALASEAQEPV